jgi:uncharacterized protein
MVLAHCHKMLAEIPASREGNPVGWLITLLVAEKDRTIFAFLFGVSFAVMMRRIEARHLPVVPLFLRRLFVLYLIGCVAEVFTRFTILRDYAWWGIPLLFLRGQPTRSLLAFAIICAAAFAIRDGVDTAYSVINNGLAATRTTQVAQQRDWDAETTAGKNLQNGNDYGPVILGRVHLLFDDIVSAKRLLPGLYLALFILGLLAVRHGILDDPKRHRRLIVGLMATGLACWAIAWWLLPLVPADLGTPRIAGRLRAGLGLVDEQFLAFTYIGAVALLLAYRPNLAAAGAPLGWVGRMALTNYLLHIAVIEYACASHGLNLRLTPTEELLAAGLLFGALALFSWFWLRRFRYGPVEWVWRSLTYWQPQPLRLAEAAAEKGE